MAITFGFFHDAALTNPIEAGDTLTGSHVAGASDYTDKTIYFGSAEIGTKAQVNADPGVTGIIVSIADADGGTGAATTEFRLSLSAITGAETPGASITLSHTVTSGVANAIPIYTRRTSAIAVAGSYTDISLTAQELIETPV
jgi:hypothetical protein